MEAREGMEKGAMVGEILAQLEEGAGPEGPAVRHLQDVQGLLDKNQCASPPSLHPLSLARILPRVPGPALPWAALFRPPRVSPAVPACRRSRTRAWRMFLSPQPLAAFAAPELTGGRGGRMLMSEISQNQRRGGPEDLAANHALIKEADENMREMLTQYEETTSELLGLARGEEPRVPPGDEGAQPAPQPAAPEWGALGEGAPGGASLGGVTPQ